MPLRSFSIAALSPNPLIVRFAPCAASARAIARPMPDVEPVTSADFPFSMTTPNSGGRPAEGRPEDCEMFAGRRECDVLLAALQHKNQWVRHVFAIQGHPL